ncbi:hypothetical protein SLT36_17395 [Aminobacter sp. BA135]|uniref:hypothetical protein n=1 Tax=Aminobacter sp. BA135 TaxID=537596 RepID=UPI003D7BB2C0
MTLPASTGSNRQAVLHQVVRDATHPLVITERRNPDALWAGGHRIVERCAESETFVAAIHVSLTLRQHGTVTSNL